MDGTQGRLSAAASASAGHPVLVHSFEQWREAARDLLAHHVAPQIVQWISHKNDGDLFASAPPATAHEALPAPDGACALRVPRQLMEMLQSAACCRVPNRWAFLYLVLWRWQQGEKDVMSPADDDGARLHAMVKAVKREIHDMHACIRFRERREDAGPPRFVAWFEPGHDVLPQVAQHFAARMGRVTWMIATPDASVMWDGERLHTTGPLMRGPEDIDDAGEALWLPCYRSIFIPARLNAELLANGKLVPIAAGKAQPRRATEASPASLDQCRRCELWQHATQAVAGEGPAKARIMLVGEQPGDQEDLQGKPFVGPAGQLLDRALHEAALDRRQVWITNAVKHFKWEPRGKRRLHKTPAQREIDACSYWLQQELAQVGPKVVVALGSTALKAVLDNPHATLKDCMGQPIAHGGRWVVTIYHPAYALRVPDAVARERAFRSMVEGLKQAHALAKGPQP